MAQYIEITDIKTLLEDITSEVSNLTELKAWLKTDDFKERLAEYSQDEITKLEVLSELISILEKYEKEMKDVQLEKFQTLEMSRKAAAYAFKLEESITGRTVHDDTYLPPVEVRECNYPPCGNTFIADPPSKHYCSDKCREKAKKWRKRHN